MHLAGEVLGLDPSGREQSQFMLRYGPGILSCSRTDPTPQSFRPSVFKQKLNLVCFKNYYERVLDLVKAFSASEMIVWFFFQFFFIVDCLFKRKTVLNG